MLSFNPLATIIHPNIAAKNANKMTIPNLLINHIGNHRLYKKYIKGNKKTKPINRAQSRWKYSQKNINLNSESVISPCSDSNCFFAAILYLSNAIFHSSAFKGGNVPCMTAHSVIDSPESVNLVTPPITT